MADDLHLSSGSKEEKYASLYPQIAALLEGETDVTANMANTCAALMACFRFLWVGFYVVKGEELILAPFQGPVACTRIRYGRGVCGTAWSEACSLIVPDVDAFPGHITCSSRSRSEIVVPLLQHGEVWAVLDIDSEELSTFDTIDRAYLERICDLL